MFDDPLYIILSIHTQRVVLYQNGMGVVSRECIGWSMKLTTQLYLMPRLRTSGAIPLLPLYAFTTWTETDLRFLNYWDTGWTTRGNVLRHVEGAREALLSFKASRRTVGIVRALIELAPPDLNSGKNNRCTST